MLIQRHMRSSNDLVPALGFLREIIRRGLWRATDRFGRKLGKAFLHLGIMQRRIDAG